jgi:hypothetical protein
MLCKRAHPGNVSELWVLCAHARLNRSDRRGASVLGNGVHNRTSVLAPIPITHGSATMPEAIVRYALASSRRLISDPSPRDVGVLLFAPVLMSAINSDLWPFSLLFCWGQYSRRCLCEAWWFSRSGQE